MAVLRSPVKILEEEVCILVGQLFEANIVALHARDNLVVNVSEIAHMIYIVATILQPALVSFPPAPMPTLVLGPSPPAALPPCSPH